MINGDIDKFMAELSYQDHDAVYNGDKYFFNGAQCQFDDNGNVKRATIEIYNLTKDETIFSVERPSIRECLQALMKAKIFDGKTIYEVEKEIEWTG